MAKTYEPIRNGRRKVSARVAAERLGVTPRTIRNYMASPREEYEAEARQRRDLMVLLYRQGAGVREIARMLGMSPSWVSERLKEAREAGESLERSKRPPMGLASTCGGPYDHGLAPIGTKFDCGCVMRAFRPVCMNCGGAAWSIAPTSTPVGGYADFTATCPGCGVSLDQPVQIHAEINFENANVPPLPATTTKEQSTENLHSLPVTALR